MDSGVNKEWIQGLGPKGVASERTTMGSRSEGPVRGRH